MFIQLCSVLLSSVLQKPRWTTGSVNQGPTAPTDSYSQFGFTTSTDTPDFWQSAQHLMLHKCLPHYFIKLSFLDSSFSGSASLKWHLFFSKEDLYVTQNQKILIKDLFWNARHSTGQIILVPSHAWNYVRYLEKGARMCPKWVQKNTE